MSHIVHVVESFGGGVASIIIDIANCQIQDGHQVSLVYSLRAETLPHWQTLLDPRINSYYLPMVRSIHLLHDLKSGWRLWRCLKRLSPHIIHLHSSKAGALGRLISLFYQGPRYFFSPHGLSFLQADTKNSRKRWLFLILEKLLSYCPVIFIACSASEASVVKRLITDRVVMVENAANTKNIRLKKGYNTPLRIASVGRICAQKNPEAFAKIAQACQCLLLDFIWIGAGDKDQEALLRSSGVKVTGWLSRQAVQHLLSDCDIYLQTSRWEGMPIAVIEAMLTGLACIVSDVIGNCDLIDPNKTGLLAKNTMDFIEGIQMFVHAPDKVMSMGWAARVVALNRFSLSRMSHALYQVYGLS